MIEVKELRIGNYVLHEVMGICKVFDISKTGFSCEKDKSWFIAGNAKPIPLTPEILVKCGFEFYEPLKHYRLVKNDQWYSMTAIKFSNLPEKVLCFSWTNLNANEGESMPIKHLPYLHQLQNLFYFIDGEELIYKP
jgi:hypothetical protein